MKPWRSTKYRKWIAEQPCVFTNGPAIAHHARCFGQGGMGTKPSDAYCLPVNQDAVHFLIDNQGEISVYRQFIPGGHDMTRDEIKGYIAERCLRYLTKYLTEVVK